ncbi:allantoinase [Haloferula luteola]|uniref:Allantoinase n=1 Tax=Haloferula luteola TaxID=595692 RepID=A0A840V270_9BACT|nr:allantoinase AllB [Haloferula luteola]MBB5351533.1 allantoinase [Haloferula luteola]
MYDLLVHALAPDGQPLSLAVEEGFVVDSGPSVSGSALEEMEAIHAVLLPAWIDSHVHFNEPGRQHWEGIATGSRALAAGGGCAFFDMPLNSSPPVTTRERLEEKRRLAESLSHLDFALWGGLTPDSIRHLPEMAAAGAIAFKAFMCDSGIDEFPAADAATLREGMRIAADLHLPVGVHAEIAQPRQLTGHDMAAWLESRPIDFELDAIQLALDLAHETGCALHIVHVTCPEGIDLVTTAKSAGIDVTVETCPHYLLLDTDDAQRIGAAAKCAPPLRSPATVAALWQRLLSGQIDTLGSDHSPSSPELKIGDDLFAIWGGIAGIQHGLPLLFQHAMDFAPAWSSRVASRFRLPHKGHLLPGFEADFVLVESNSEPISTDQLLTRHPLSPYLGFTPRYRIAETFLRGQRVAAQTRGRFLRPSHTEHGPMPLFP